MAPMTVVNGWIVCREYGSDRSCDGIDLRHAAGAECRNHGEYAEDYGKPFPFFAEAVLDVVHRPADKISFVVLFPIMNGEDDFCVFGAHAKQGGNPHPEDRTRTADGDGSCHAGDIAGADCSRKCSCERLYRRKRSLFIGGFSVKKLSDRVFHDRSKFAELQKAKPCAQEDSRTE